MPCLPLSLARLLESFRPCFSTRTFTTITVLVAGLIAAPAQRTVCGMLTAGRMSPQWHHSRAHRFFAASRWSLDRIGIALFGLVIGWLVPIGAPVVVAVDDTMFRRSGRSVHAAAWAYDGSRRVAAGEKKLSHGTTFVVAAVVVALPFLERPIALPAMARLRRPGGPTKTVLARDLIGLLAAARPDRRIHVVTDGAYLCSALRYLPTNVTLTGPLPRNAALWQAHPHMDTPPRLRGKRGRPRTRGDKIGTPDQLANTTPAQQTTVTRYGRTKTVDIHQQRCFWYAVFRSRPVQVILIREPRHPDLALVTTDVTTATQQIVERYASRWSIEVAFADAKHINGIGEARNRTRRAVERTVPFGLFVQSLVILWYHVAGHSPRVVADRRNWARWYTTKTHPSYHDMIVKLRRVLIAAQFRVDQPADPTPEQIQTIRMAWADLGT